MPVFIMSKPGFKFQPINALQFADIWNHLDESQTGTIEGSELDAFFYELAKYVLDKEPTQEEFIKIKNKFNARFGTKEVITMETLAKILLPSDEQFLLFFRKNIPLKSSVTFMQIWRKYDQNNSGYLNVHELQSFVKDYVTAANRYQNEEKVEDYATSINESLKQRKKDFEKIFKHYDQSGTGALEGAEIDGFMKDMVESMQGKIQAKDLDRIKDTLLDHVDLNKDGKLQKSELAMYIGVYSRKQNKNCCILN